MWVIRRWPLSGAVLVRCLSFIVFLFFALQSFGANSTIAHSTQRIEIQVSLRNIGDFPLYDLRVELEKAQSPRWLRAAEPLETVDLLPGKQITLSMPLFIDTDGVDTETAVLGFVVKDNLGYIWRETKRITLPLPVYTSRLLQNYPNPFNPETVIPYQLGEESQVTIKIYDVTGKLVRTLDLGKKKAGLYLSTEKAARWDGKNEKGEKVTSGIYIYTMRAGTFSASRKMIVLK